MTDVVVEPEVGVLPELKLFPPKVESYGVTDRGGRPHNEDAFFTSSQGFIPAEFDVGEYEDMAKTEGLPKAQAKYLVDLLKGVETLDITEEDVLGLQQNVQDLIAQGKIGGLEVVADGAGGQGSGELASTVGTFVTIQQIIRKGKEGKTITSETLHEAITVANTAVKKVNGKLYGGGGEMATTIVAALIAPDGKRAYVDSVGDSRAYLVDAKAGKVVQITDDHSLVFVNLKNGNLKVPSEIFTHHYKSVITRCLGSDDGFEIQSHEVELDKDKALVLCSDGIWEDIDLKNNAVKVKLEEIDQEFNENTAGGMERNEAAKIAFGRIFREINLRNLEQSLGTPQVIVDTLTYGAGQYSVDNVTAVAIKPC